MNETIRAILSEYDYENPGVRTNLARILNQGRLAGTGKLVILPVDQGWEHGPARSFAPNPAGYDPLYHFQLAIDAGCYAYAAPLGSLETGAARFAGEIPLILKVNNHEMLFNEPDPVSYRTSGVEDALRLGCSAIGYTIYPGSSEAGRMYEQLSGMIVEAKRNGLAVVVWSYPRGTQLSQKGETAIDVVTYAAQIAAQLGANIIKIKLPSDFIEQDAARKVYEAEKIPIGTLTDRVKHVVQSAFDGRRIVIFSGGGKTTDDAIFDQMRAIRDGGGFGSIIGRNSFQRSKADGVALLHKIMDIYAGDS